jgi:hypothetical protein
MESVVEFVVQLVMIVMLLGSMAMFLSLAIPLLYDAYREFRRSLK